MGIRTGQRVLGLGSTGQGASTCVARKGSVAQTKWEQTRHTGKGPQTHGHPQPLVNPSQGSTLKRLPTS